MNYNELFSGFMMGMLITFCFMMFIPIQCVEKYHKQQAVDHGAASWVVDQKTGETTFKWKDEVK